MLKKGIKIVFSFAYFCNCLQQMKWKFHGIPKILNFLQKAKFVVVNTQLKNHCHQHKKTRVTEINSFSLPKSKFSHRESAYSAVRNWSFAWKDKCHIDLFRK